MNDDEAIRLGLPVLLGGLDTTITLMSFIMWFLAGDSAARRTLGQRLSGLPRAIEELCPPFAVTMNVHLVKADCERASAGYSTFGQGIHQCAGMVLAKLEIRIFLEEWRREPF